MSRLKGALDLLPPAARHAALVFVGAFVSEVVRRAVGLDPVTVDFAALGEGSTYAAALAVGVGAVIAALGLAGGTTLTTQYGVGKVVRGDAVVVRDDAPDGP